MGLIIKQIVEAVLARVFTIRLGTDSPRAFDHVAHLEHVAEIRLLFILNQMVNRFAALVTAVGIEMTAATTSSERNHTGIAFVVSVDGPRDSGRAATTPADKSVICHCRFLFLVVGGNIGESGGGYQVLCRGTTSGRRSPTG